MKTRGLFSLFIMLIAAGFVPAQTKSVTNADIEHYRHDRLKAQQEYLENYKRLGMPSPEEIDRRREKSRIETERLSAKLREEDLERARFEAQWRANARLADAYSPVPQVVYYPYWNSGNYFWSGWWRRPIIRHPVVTPHTQSGYFAGGQFWSTGSRATNAPVSNAPGFYR